MLILVQKTTKPPKAPSKRNVKPNDGVVDFASTMRVPASRIKVSQSFSMWIIIYLLSTRHITRMSQLRCSTSHQDTCSCKGFLTCAAFPFITPTRSRRSKKAKRQENPSSLSKLYESSLLIRAKRLQEGNSLRSMRFQRWGARYSSTARSPWVRSTSIFQPQPGIPQTGFKHVDV